MEYAEIIAELRALSSEKHKANVVRMGIPEGNSIGVSTGDIRKLARRIGRSNGLAYDLWHTGYHEAKLLAVLVFDKKTLALQEIEPLMNDVCSWDLCDHVCKNLIMKQKGYIGLIGEWCASDKTYFKRAAFILIGSAVIHEKNVSDDIMDDFMRLIQEHSFDEREHVKKAVSYALREIGKKDFNYQEKAIILAHELKESGNQAQVWIAKDALKELENLVKVEGRGRLLSADSKMGRQSK